MVSVGKIILIELIIKTGFARINSVARSIKLLITHLEQGIPTVDKIFFVNLWETLKW